MRASIGVAVLCSALAWACDGCYGPPDGMVMTRRIKRMQPEAQNATTGPKGPLEWGQLNFLHTTDTHGWLEGHLKEENYGADWGDFVSFTKHMKQKARDLGVDLLLVDTGDLHDGAGLSDATSPNGLLSLPVFENIDYDLLTIGNHELYVTEVAYETFHNFSKVYGERYLTSNVEILNPYTGQFEYIGNKYRYFTTDQGLRLMAFGVLFDFTGNSNVSKITKAEDLVKQEWFLKAVNFSEPIDAFVLTGHNPVRTNVSSSTFGTIYRAIRQSRPDIPIIALGGHSHIRDFVVYDEISVGIESGRYCETLGWLSTTGIKSDTYRGIQEPKGVPTPSRVASATASGNTSASTNSMKFARRYLDWNRRTFAYHAEGSQDHTFTTQHGVAVTNWIWSARKQLNLTNLYGCAPQTYCVSCVPAFSNGSIYSLVNTAIAATVINASRAENPRIVLTNTGSVRFDLTKGPFTYDDSFIVVPFDDQFYYIPDVPYEYASQVLDILNAGSYLRKRSLRTTSLGHPEAYPNRGQRMSARGLYFSMSEILDHDTCIDPSFSDQTSTHSHSRKSIIRRQVSSDLTPGYVTVDDFGSDGDDTIHSKIASYELPNAIQTNASFPHSGAAPEAVDLVFYDFIEDNVLDALASVGANYTDADVGPYMPASFTSNSYLPAYAKMAWQENVPNCPVGRGVGFD